MDNRELFSMLKQKYALSKRPDGRYEVSNNERCLILAENLPYSFDSIANYLDGVTEYIPLNATEKNAPPRPSSDIPLDQFNIPINRSTGQGDPLLPSTFNNNGSRDLFPDTRLHDTFYGVYKKPEGMHPSPDDFYQEDSDEERKGVPPGARFSPYGPNRRRGDPDPDNLFKPGGNKKDRF